MPTNQPPLGDVEMDREVPDLENGFLRAHASPLWLMNS